MDSKDTDKLKKRWWKLRSTAYHDFYLRQVLTPILESAFNLKITCLTFVNIALQIWLGDWDKDSVLQIDPRRARLLTDIYEEMMVGFPVRLDL